MLNFIIKDDSILNSLYQYEIEKEYFIYLEAIKHTVRMIEIIYLRLFNIILNEDNIIKNENIHFQEMIMIDAWSFVDTFYRLCKILKNLRGIKKNIPWYQYFIRSISEFEDLRHFIQHYDNKLMIINNDRLPIIGYLAWIRTTNIDKKEAVIRAILPGYAKEGQQMKLNFIHKPIHDCIDHINLYLGDFQIDICDKIRDILKFIPELDNYLKSKYKLKNTTMERVENQIP